MRTARFGVLATIAKLVTSALLFGEAGCSGAAASTESSCARSDDGGDADAGRESGTDSGLPPGCEATPRQASAQVVIDKCGVFVSPAGNDAADGSKAKPFKTIGKAISTTRGVGGRIHVCGGATQEYVETLNVTQVDANRGIFGGLSCDTWTYDEALRPSVRAPSANTSALVVNGAKGIVIEDLAFAAPDATGTSASSVGVFITTDSEVTLRRVKVTAGKGVDGTNGANGIFTFPLASLDGNSGASTVGGPAKEGASCPSGSIKSRGGGGKGGFAGALGEPGLPTITPASPASSTGAAGAVGASCTGGTLGAQGSNGNVGVDGANTAIAGAPNESGWVPSSGSDAKPGDVAQGGGGGGGPVTGAGGGGAPGGCGGEGGKAGTGGGGSIGILIVESAVTIDGASINTGTGGSGGNGGAGQGGQAGGSGAGGASGGCAGANGGTGGKGGRGGGGAGGVSVPVLYKSAKVPNVTMLVTQKGTPGAGGTGGTGTPLVGANDDVKGL